MNDIAIKIQNVKKQYRLGQIGGNTLQEELQSWWARKRGKEDPNTKIGADQRLVGKKFMALNGIDLTIYKGEAVGIIGRNGAGKSTLLKLLSRVTAPTEGMIDIYGRITSMLEVGTGFNGEMTGRENVYMNGAILGMTKAEIDSKMDQIIAFSEVGDFIDTPVKRYSSGMYVKLAFSVAAHLDSEIMIMDEVLAVGDMAFQQKCLDKMSDASRTEGKTVLYVSHNMNTIRRLCTRCIVLSEGKTIFDGDVETAIRMYMRTEQNDDVFMKCADIERPGWLRNQRVLLREIELAGKEDNIYGIDEPVKIRIKWKNLSDIENLSLRIELRNMQDQSTGTALLQNFYSGRKDDEEDMTFSLDLSMLADETYRIMITMFGTNDYENSENFDFVNAMCIRLTGRNQRNAIVWDLNNWGYYQLQDPVLI